VQKLTRRQQPKAGNRLKRRRENLLLFNEQAWARLTVLERDGYCCTRPGCRSRRDLEAHHIIPRSRGGTWEPENMTTVCADCHRKITEYRVRVTRVGDRLEWERVR